MHSRKIDLYRAFEPLRRIRRTLVQKSMDSKKAIQSYSKPLIHSPCESPATVDRTGQVSYRDSD